MRILIVEDEHKIANALKKGLEQENFAVDVVYDGLDGIGFATTKPYDLLILDRMLPNISDGLGIVKAVREEGKHMPIIMLTAKGQVNDKVDGLDRGADDYLVKPFAFEELLARVHALLRRPHQSIGQKLKVEDLELDPQTYAVQRQGKSIKLSSKEFALLEYLMRNAGRILTKEMIISHVWDYDADILPNTVEVYIGYLRNKVDKPFTGQQLITTVRGFGYQLGSAAHVS